LFLLFRALGGIADVAAWGAVLSILMKLFPNKVSTILSWTEMFFGLGYMLGQCIIIYVYFLFHMFSFSGPALGSLLYNIGGFKLPFFVVGSIGLIVATSLVFVIPNVKPDSVKKPSEKSLTFVAIAKVFSYFYVPCIKSLNLNICISVSFHLYAILGSFGLFLW
jgi:MFS family permease